MERMIAGTKNGIAILEETDRGWEVIHRSRNGQAVTSVIAREGVMIAGTRHGLLRSKDEGNSWDEINHGLTTPHVRWLAYHPEISDFEAAGTEPAGIFISRNGGDSWEGIPEVEELRDQFGWWLPYSPAAGCVRGFAFGGESAYAAVEVGGVLRSLDSGKSWELAPGSSGKPDFSDPPAGYVHPDVHMVACHPTNPQIVFAMTNGGSYRSNDSGIHWERINANGYTRAGWINPTDPDHIVIGPAKQVGQFGTILESRDGGVSWHEQISGTNAPWPATMVERFNWGAGYLWAVLDNGDLLHTKLDTMEWAKVSSISGVNAITMLADWHD